MWHSVEDSQPRPKQGSDPCFSKDGLVILKESDARVETRIVVAAMATSPFESVGQYNRVKMSLGRKALGDEVLGQPLLFSNEA